MAPGFLRKALAGFTTGLFVAAYELQPDRPINVSGIPASAGVLKAKDSLKYYHVLSPTMSLRPARG
jgi:hypothetical protein